MKVTKLFILSQFSSCFSLLPSVYFKFKFVRSSGYLVESNCFASVGVDIFRLYVVIHLTMTKPF